MKFCEMQSTLQDILDLHRKNKHQQFLADVLNKWETDVFEQVVNQELNLITPAEVREFGLSHFQDVDRYPNPRDNLLGRDEITEAMALAYSNREKAILLWIWLHFDEIRAASVDFEGPEKIFDLALTLKDFELMNVS